MIHRSESAKAAAASKPRASGDDPDGLGGGLGDLM